MAKGFVEYQWVGPEFLLIRCSFAAHFFSLFAHIYLYAAFCFLGCNDLLQRVSSYIDRWWRWNGWGSEMIFITPVANWLNWVRHKLAWSGAARQTCASGSKTKHKKRHAKCVQSIHQSPPRPILYKLLISLPPAFPFIIGTKGEVVEYGDEGAAGLLQYLVHSL